MAGEVACVRFVKFLFVLVLFAAGVAAFFVLVPYGPSSETFVEIPLGTGTTGIAQQLQQNGVIRNRYAFEAVRGYKEITGAAGTLKAGEYRFDHPVSVLEAYDRIRRGDVYTIALVIPEGYNIYDIAQAVGAAKLADPAAFLKAEQTHTDLIRLWSPHAKSLEGYLFPDTYKFSRRATPAQMLARMVERFAQETATLGLTSTDIPKTVTMASLVEKEVHFNDERAKVASVFVNRLDADMPLQTDPAVAYASLLRGTWTGVIHQSELQSDSLYNTYTHKGLPPGPICNPGMAALKAAIHPAQTQYLYFVASANGRSKFSTNLTEHNANVAVYRAAAK
jgi:UPF0755 protein